MIARLNGRSAAFAAVSLVALAALNGCTTLGGNVKGDFSCAAPDGICAPSSTIDDRALAMISGDAGDTMIPAGPYQAPAQQPRAMRTAASVPAPMPDRSAVPGSRTREKVLRVVFQPYVDDRGRLHEASAVHTVVQSEWQAQALADATPIPDRNPAARPTGVSLSEVVDRDAPGYIDVAEIDPNLPDPAVVAAARARKPNPVEAIKADVQSKLGQRGKRRAAPPTPAPASGTRTSAVAPAARAPVPVSAGVPAPTVAQGAPVAKPAQAATQAGVLVHRGSAAGATGQLTALVSAPKTASGPEAIARIKGSEAYRNAQERTEATARDAGASAPAPGLKALTSPTIRAASFPASVPEDK
ncbi:TraV family lipoprotein [Sphingobium sp. HBC34]|uniref:TraV family lipoprotein n=1 Tax=Sphingobium cyanobacteriorum TaxID=3063954 RepID=A0ABT8ZUX2_9SPHN|nr:TraV family lipoprotein [Sphingobium sp. HBC34]MDO7837251.1 TraV family lipoprotein [Sphingobium sp. HBC34]